MCKSSHREPGQVIECAGAHLLRTSHRNFVDALGKPWGIVYSVGRAVSNVMGHEVIGGGGTGVGSLHAMLPPSQDQSIKACCHQLGDIY